MIILNNNINDIKRAAELLRNGKLVAFPTETVYGVGCIYNNIDSYNALNNLKRRAPNKPYTLMLSSVLDIKKYANIQDNIYLFLKNILPGPITVLLKAKDNLPKHTYKDGIIGIRIPQSKVALSLLNEVKVPLLVPSLNRSGEAPIKEKEIIIKEFDKELDGLIVDKISNHKPSTVISLVNGFKIIREGELSSTYLFKEYQKYENCYSK